MKFTNKVYDTIKHWITIPIPWAACLYYILSLEFPDMFPNGIQVLFGFTALISFFGLLIGISSHLYEGDGTLQIDESGEDKEVYRFVFQEDPHTFTSKKLVVLKIKKNAK